MPDTALSSMTAVATPAPTTDLIYVVQSGPLDRKATVSQYVGGLIVDTADNLAVRNGTTAQTFRVYGTYTDASNYERFSISYTGGAYVMGSQAAGTGSGRVVIIATSNTNRWQFDTSGHFVALTDNSFDIGGSASANRPRNIYVGTAVVTPTVSEVTAGSGVTVDGATIRDGQFWGAQGAPTAETGAATITIADILTGIVTLNQSTGATVALTLDTGTAMDTGKPASIGADMHIDWYLINLSAAAADTGTLTAATGHTIVGNPIIQSAHVSTGGVYGNSAHFRSRRTAANTWITYRLA